MYPCSVLCHYLQGINVSLFWEKVSSKDYVPVCPTSAITGDGMGDLMALLALVSQKQLQEKLMFSEELECHVLEVRSYHAHLGHTH